MLFEESHNDLAVFTIYADSTSFFNYFCDVHVPFAYPALHSLRYDRIAETTNPTYGIASTAFRNLTLTSVLSEGKL